MKKEYIKGIYKFIVSKNERNLYDYSYQEYSEICDCWYNVSRDKDYTKEALEMTLDIVIDF